jgi:hypothetical protein
LKKINKLLAKHDINQEEAVKFKQMLNLFVNLDDENQESFIRIMELMLENGLRFIDLAKEK